MKRAVLVLWLVGCGGSGSDYTKGDGCTAIGTSVCNRSYVCGLITPQQIAECDSVFVLSCCGGPPNTCQAPGAMDRSENCATAVFTASCQSIADGILPSTCFTGR